MKLFFRTLSLLIIITSIVYLPYSKLLKQVYAGGGPGYYGDVTFGSDGNLWYTKFGKVGKMMPNGTVTEFSIANNPEALTNGPDGNMWFTVSNPANYIVQITLSGTMTVFPIPNNSTPIDITSGPDGNLWYADYGQIGRFTTSGVVTLFPLQDVYDTATGITNGPDGNLWFTDSHCTTTNESDCVGEIGKITPAGVISYFMIPTSFGLPNNITTGPDNNLWFTSNNNMLGRITPDGTINDYTLPTGYSFSYDITKGPDNNLWFTNSGDSNNGSSFGAIGRITPNGNVTEFNTNYSIGYGISNGPNNKIWFIDPSSNIGWITLSGTVSTPPPTPTPTPISSPPAISGSIYSTMNTSESPPDGVWFRNSPHTADTDKVTGHGIYAGDSVALACYIYGDAVGSYNNSLWYYAQNITRPTIPSSNQPNSGYINAHYINDGKAANQVDAGVPPCTGVPSFTSSTTQIIQQSHSTSTSSNNTVKNGEPINMIGGNYLATRHEFTVPGRDLPVDFYLNYNSNTASQSGIVGFGWTHSYLVSVTPYASGSALVQNEDGRLDLYTPNGNGGFTPPSDIHANLTKTTIGYQLIRRDHTKYTFTATGQLTSIVSPNDNTQTLSYNSQNELTSLTDVVGRTFAFSYDNNGHLTQMTDPSNRTVKYTYDNDGNLSTATDFAGNVTTYHYDAGHRITVITDPGGNVAVTNIYDTLGRVITQTNALGKQITLSYAPGQTNYNDPKGNKTIYFYDDQSRLTKTQDANGGATSYTYDANDNQNSITDPNGNKTSLVYDANGNVTQLTNAKEGITTFTYDSKSNLLSKTDPLGHTTSYTYDANNNLIKQTNPAGNSSVYNYDSFGELTIITDPLHAISKLAYDSKGDVITITNPLGQNTNIAYDNIGKPIATTNPSGDTTNYVYDALDRLTQIKNPLGNMTSYAFDADGNKTKLTDPNAHITTYVYNPANELTQVTDALGHMTTYSYDANGNLAGTTDANNHTTTYSYDVMNRLILSVNPLGQKTTRTYDADGNVVSSTDPKNQTTTFTYDPLNQLTNISYTDHSSILYSYDAEGNRSQMTDATGTTTYSYDVLGNLLKVTSPDNKTVLYAYDAKSRQTLLAYPDGRKETYAYNNANELTTATDWQNKSTTYSYDPSGNVTDISYPNGASISSKYDQANQLTSVLNKPKEGTATEYAYSFDATGNKLSMTQNTEAAVHTFPIPSILNNMLQDITNQLPFFPHTMQSNGQTYQTIGDGMKTTYTYDALNRLTAVHGTGVTQSFSFDPVGNRLSETNYGLSTKYAYDAADELLKSGDTSYSYDANGNRIQKTDHGTTTTYAYNLSNELTKISTNRQINQQYIYNGDGLRTQITDRNSISSYLWNVNGLLPQVLSQTTANATLDYQYGLNLISSANFQSNDRSYYFYDGLGSVVGLTNNEGMPSERYSFDAYGNPLLDAHKIGQTKQNPFGFAGQQQDAETGLIYMRGRYYDPSTGTFLTRDSFPSTATLPTTLNRYAYVQDNPVNDIDPTGLCAINPFSHQSCINSAAHAVGNVVSSGTEWANTHRELVGNVAGIALGTTLGAICTLSTGGVGLVACSAVASVIGEGGKQLVTGNFSLAGLVASGIPLPPGLSIPRTFILSTIVNEVTSLVERQHTGETQYTVPKSQNSTRTFSSC